MPSPTSWARRQSKLSSERSGEEDAFFRAATIARDKQEKQTSFLRKRNSVCWDRRHPHHPTEIGTWIRRRMMTVRSRKASRTAGNDKRKRSMQRMTPIVCRRARISKKTNKTKPRMLRKTTATTKQTFPEQQ